MKIEKNCDICTTNIYLGDNFDVEISKAIKNIFKKTGIKIPYNILIKDWDIDDCSGSFCQFCEKIEINKHILNNDKWLETVIYHEFLHLFLQVETKLFYDILNKRYINLFFYYLNKFCFNYKIIYIDFETDILLELTQSNEELLKNVELLNNYESISDNYNQFKMLSEFIIYNSDYYYQCNFNDDFFIDKELLEMNKFVLNLIKK